MVAKAESVDTGVLYSGVCRARKKGLPDTEEVAARISAQSHSPNRETPYEPTASS